MAIRDDDTLMTLTELLPTPDPGVRRAPDPDAVYEVFTTWAEDRGITLYPAQDEAFLEILTGSNVILSTPTGSGKSLVATAAHATALARGERTYYTAPIKALVSEKFFALCEVFGPENVGMLTGDAAVNRDAPVICCTAEILANQALREGAAADIGQVVMDEFHFYAEPDRGWAWQVPLLELPHAQFLLMSATLGDVGFFRDDLTRRTGRETAVVSSMERPVPLSYAWAETPLHETLEELLTTHQAPVYVVHFTQAAALERAQALTSVHVATREQRDRIAELIGGVPLRPRLRQDAVPAGQARHRRAPRGDAAEVPPARRDARPGRAAQGHLRHRHPRRRHQRADPHRGAHRPDEVRRAPAAGPQGAGVPPDRRTGRPRRLRHRRHRRGAGPRPRRRERQAVAKAGDDPKKLRKVQRKKPPEGQVTWSRATFDRLVEAEPEALVSRMRVTHAMLLNVLARDGDPFAALRHLLRDNHEDGRSQVRLVRRAVAQYRSLVTAGVVLQTDGAEGTRCRLVEDLQDGFALNQPLSTYALATFDTLDPEAATYALDVVSVVEATLEDPRPVLLAQQFKARGEAVAEMKADGVEYDERIELLDDVTWPKPLEELLEATYTLYARTHPWIAESPLSPKTVVRDLYEQAMTFPEYVAAYGLARSEGLLLRYLSDAYRALRQTVPDRARTDELEDLVAWLGAVVRQTDSSLLDEWEQLTDPTAVPVEPDPLRPPEPERITANRRAFTVLVRNALFRRVELAARRRGEELEELDGEVWAEPLAAYFEEHDRIGSGPDARGPDLFLVEEGPTSWSVQQIIDDPEGHHDWRIVAEVDLRASDEAGELILRNTHLTRL